MARHKGDRCDDRFGHLGSGLYPPAKFCIRREPSLMYKREMHDHVCGVHVRGKANYGYTVVPVAECTEATQ